MIPITKLRRCKRHEVNSHSFNQSLFYQRLCISRLHRSPCLEEIQAAKVQTRVILKSATGSKKQQITYVLDRLNDAENILMSSLNNSNYGGGLGGGYPSPPVRDDNSGSVSFRCENIADMSAEAACEAFKILDQPPQDAVRLYRSESCSGPMTGIISLNSRCDTIPSSLGDV